MQGFAVRNGKEGASVKKMVPLILMLLQNTDDLGRKKCAKEEAREKPTELAPQALAGGGKEKGREREK